MQDGKVYVIAWNADFDSTDSDVTEVVLPEAPVDPATAWHHVAFTVREGPLEGADAPSFKSIDSTQLKWFLNGKLVGTKTVENRFRLSPVGPAYLAGIALDAVTRFPGKDSKTEDRHLHYFRGSITDFRVWRTALTDTKIVEGMRSAPLAEEAGDSLVAYHPLAESTGSGPYRDPRSVDTPDSRFGHVAEFVRDSMVLFPGDMTSDAGYSHFAKPEARAWRNYEFTGRFFLSEAADFLGVTVLSQHTAEGTPLDRFYALLWEKKRQTFRLYCHTPALQSLVGKLDLGVTPKPGKWYGFSITAVGGVDSTVVSASVWLEDTPVPKEAQATGTDSSIYRLVAGTVGVWTQGAGKKFVDKLAVRGLPAPTPTTPEASNSAAQGTPTAGPPASGTVPPGTGPTPPVAEPAISSVVGPGAVSSGAGTAADAAGGTPASLSAEPRAAPLMEANFEEYDWRVAPPAGGKLDEAFWQVTRVSRVSTEVSSTLSSRIFSKYFLRSPKT